MAKENYGEKPKSGKKKALVWLIVLVILAGVGVGLYFLITNLKKPTYTVRAYYGSEIVGTYDVKEGKSFDLSTITYEGYKIIAIYDNRDLSGEPLSGKIKITKDVNLFLDCEKLYNIKLTNGTEVINIYYEEGDVVENPYLPIKEHARFLGWAKSSEIILSPTLPYIVDIADFEEYTLILTAVWEEAFSIQFNSNGGQAIENLYGFSDEEVSLPAASRDHYVFTGWSTVAGSILNAGDKITLTENITLTASWREENYTITFDTKGNGAVASVQTKYNATITLPQVTQSGMVFIGWQYGSQIFSSLNQFTVPDLGDDNVVVTFVAYFEIEEYIINFNSDGGDVINPFDVKYQEEITLPVVSKEGYTFIGWQHNNQTYTGKYTVQDLGEDDASVTFKALWKVESYTISFDGLGYQEFEDITVTYGQKWNLPQFPALESYNFNGWKLDKTILTGTVPDLGNDGDKFTVVADISIKSYVFVFNLNGGYFEDESQVKTLKANFGDKIIFPAALKDGYEFLGWECEDKTFSDNYTVENLDELVTNNNTINCSAIWEPKTVIVTFDYGDKEVVSGGNVVSISYVVGSDYSDFPSPVYKEPYIFVGWSTSESEYKRPVITSDITLYAIVEEETDINAFGSGTAEDPYRIYNRAQMEYFNYVGTSGTGISMHAYFELQNDLEMDGFTSTFANSEPNITFDGQDHILTLTNGGALINSYRFTGTICNLKLKFSNSMNGGTFLATENHGTIKNITILENDYTVNANTSSTSSSVRSGAITGYNSGIIENCINYANFDISSSKTSTFAVFAVNNSGTIQNCINYGDITGKNKVLVGVITYQNSGNLLNCMSYGNISGYQVGGLAVIHNSGSPLSIANCEIHGSYSAISPDSVNMDGYFGCFQTDTISNVVFQDCKYSASGLNVLAVWRPATGINYVAGFEELAKYFTKCDITQEIIKVDAPLIEQK